MSAQGPPPLVDPAAPVPAPPPRAPGPLLVRRGAPADHEAAPPDLVRQLAGFDASWRAMARDDPAAFASYVLREEGTNAPVRNSRTHEAWHGLLDRYRRVVIWAHVEAGKSTQVSLARVAWEIGNDPMLRVVLVMRTDGQAQKLCGALQKLITSPEYRAVFPHVERDRSRPWTAHQFTVKRNSRSPHPTFAAYGVHGKVLGARVDLLVMDDVVDHENTMTKNGRDDLRGWFESTLEGRLTTKSRVWIVGTAWHKDDLLHAFSRAPGWVARRFPVLDRHGRPTWPENWSADRIEEKRLIMPPAEFSRQLLCVARSDATARFKEAWVKACVERGAGESPIYAFPNATPPEYCSVYHGVDLGVRTSDGSDVTAIFSILLRPNGDRLVLNCVSGRWAGPGIIEQIKAVHARYGGVFTVENNAAQQHIIDFTKDQTAIPVRPYTTTGRTFRSWEFGIEAMAVEMSLGKWIVPSRGGVLVPELSAWRDEVLAYDPAAHPGDRLMASWFAREGAHQANPLLEALRRRIAAAHPGRGRA